MKKTILFLSIALLILSHKSKAQNAYFKFAVGYGLPSGSQTLTTQNNSTTTQTGGNTVTTSTDKAIRGSYGSGLNLGVSFGKLLSKNIGYDLTVGYLIGKKYESSSSSTGFGQTSNTSSNMYSRSVSLTPSLFIVASDHKLKPYIKGGLVVALNTLKGGLTSSSSGSANGTELALEYTGGISLGFKGSVGIEFSPIKKTSFFADLAFTSMSYYPKKGEITKYYQDGVDRLSTLTTHDRQTDYSDQITDIYSSNSSTNPNEPTHSLSQGLPFGAIGLQFGVRINLGSTITEGATTK